MRCQAEITDILSAGDSRDSAQSAGATDVPSLLTLARPIGVLPYRRRDREAAVLVREIARRASRCSDILWGDVLPRTADQRDARDDTIR